LNKFLRAGASSAISLASLIGFGASSSAQAQQTTVPTPALSAPWSFKSALPAAPAASAVTAATAGQPLARGNIYTLPLRPAPVRAAPAVQPLSTLVATHGEGPALDAEATCLATAVYFESMGEPLEGQLAVAQVVINRAKSGRYPTSWCGVVKQKAQFSFVRSGQFPRVDAGCQAWRKAQAIARIASASMAQVLPTDVLWYHADYVAPSWGRRLARVEKIGAHIFYRA
jgi:spore germination cell wall hydrolase CwlJ-like protein